MTPECRALHRAQAIAYSGGGDLNMLADAIASAIRAAEQSARVDMRDHCVQVLLEAADNLIDRGENAAAHAIHATVRALRTESTKAAGAGVPSPPTARWEPGDPRCDACDNGVVAEWPFCAWCGALQAR